MDVRHPRFRERAYKCKARLARKGFMQVEGIDYSEAFSSLSKYNTVRLVLGLITKNKWKRKSLDVKTAFLNVSIDRELYARQPEGFKIPEKEETAYRLLKVLPGLKQASRLWHHYLYGFLLLIGFKNTYADPSLYTTKDKETRTIIFL